MTSQEEAILAQVDAQLNAMDTPSSAEVFYGLEEFSPRHQVAAAARVAKAGGGGGGNVPFVGVDPPDSPTDGMLWWDPDDDTPASGFVPIQAAYSGGPVSIANGNTGNIPFTNLDDGTDLLDRSTPDVPRVLAAGTYAVTASVFSSAQLTAGGFVSLTLTQAVAPAYRQAIHPESGEEVVIVGNYAANEELSVGLYNQDGVASRDFTGYILVVKLA